MTEETNLPEMTPEPSPDMTTPEPEKKKRGRFLKAKERKPKPKKLPAGKAGFLGNLRIRTKFIGVIVGLSLIAVVILFAVNITNTQEILTEQETEALSAISHQRADGYNEMLMGRVSAMVGFAAALDHQDNLVSQNESYTGSQTFIESQILRLDEQWREAGENNTFVLGVLQNELADETTYFLDTFNTYFVETFITDRYGANVAAAARTSDYYQADEGWWQSAYNDGKGAVYIGEIEYDESSGVWGFNMAVPIYSE
ncbi:MAG: hypothetical protein E3J88_05940, partial [Anaerolineales bacterium]